MTTTTGERVASALHDYTATTAESIQALADDAFARADELIAQVATPTGERTYETILGPLDDALAIVSNASGQTAFMRHVHPDPQVREVAERIDERTDKWRLALAFNEGLRDAVRGFADTHEAAALDAPARVQLERWLRDFRRAGGDLNPAKREELQRLRNRIIEVEVAFQANVTNYRDALELTRDELDGLDDDYIARLEPGKQPGTYRVSLDYPELYPFLEQATRRDLRQQMEFKHFNRAVAENRPLLEELLAVRLQAARLLGYRSWEEFQLETKMAGTPDAVERFHGDVFPRLQEKARDEIAAMRPLLAKDTGDDTFRSWDRRYYDDQLRRRDYGLDQAELSQYLSFDVVLGGLLSLTGEVFGLEFERIAGARAWHPDVVLYAVRDRPTGRLLGHFYADLYPREGKFGHAAAWPLAPGRVGRPGEPDELPVAAIVVNLPKPTPETPSLFRHGDVVTLFHEFGHVLALVMQRSPFVPANVGWREWDFVEAPSQIMEHWAWSPEILSRFGRHHRTDDPIPADLAQRLADGRFVNVALTTLMWSWLAEMDLRMHDSEETKNLDAIYRAAWDITGLPFHEGTFVPTGFGHIAGGYDAGYYGYLWAQVYGDDMFSRFEREGLTSTDVGAAYRREIIEPFGWRRAIDSLHAFLGREPSNDTFLRMIGVGPPADADQDS